MADALEGLLPKVPNYCVYLQPSLQMLVSRETGELRAVLGEGEEAPAQPWQGAEPWGAPSLAFWSLGNVYKLAGCFSGMQECIASIPVTVRGGFLICNSKLINSQTVLASNFYTCAFL